MTEAALQARGLHSVYGDSHILHGVDFRLGMGEAVGLMGRNGMGKSTLLKSLVGVVRPRSGEVSVFGRPTRAMKIHDIARLGIAYVPEGRGIFPNLSVRENLTLAARPARARSVPAPRSLHCAGPPRARARAPRPAHRRRRGAAHGGA